MHMHSAQNLDFTERIFYIKREKLMILKCKVFTVVEEWVHFDSQFIEPCKQLEWDAKETEIFLESLVNTCNNLDSLHK